METLLSNNELIISDDGYYDDPAISASWLKIFKDNPRYYKDLKSGHKKIIESKAMMFGRMFHTYLLEPHLMSTNFIHEKTLADRVNDQLETQEAQWRMDIREEFFATPFGTLCKEEYKDKDLTLRNSYYKKFMAEKEKKNGGSLRFKFDKKEWKEQFLTNNKLATITTADYLLLDAMKLSIEETLSDYLQTKFNYKKSGHQFLKELADGKHTEIAFFWKDEYTKIPLKTKIDSVFTLPGFNRPIILEFKTVHELQKLTHDGDDYATKVYKPFEYLHYYLQMAFNIAGFRSQYPNHDPLFLWCIVEKKAGRNYSTIFEPDERYREIARDHFRGDLMKLKHAMALKQFPLLNYDNNQLISPTNNLIVFAESEYLDTPIDEEDFNFFN